MRTGASVGGLILGAVALAGAAEGDPRLGVWRAEGEKLIVFQLEGERAHLVQEGRHYFFRVRYETGEVVASAPDRTIRWKTSIEAGVLTVEVGREVYRCRKVAKLAPEWELKALVLGKAQVSGERADGIVREIRRRVEADQKARVPKADLAEMSRVDPDNTRWLKMLVEEVGWIDAKRFGGRAANDAFLIVQHSGDVPLMMAALPEIERDVKLGRADGQAYALLFDRLQLRLGERQRYGSQIGGKPGSLVVLPLEDRMGVDRLRFALGMGSLADYLELFRADNGGKLPGFAEAE